MEKYIDYLESKNALIGSVGIFENGKPMYKRNFGQAALGKGGKKFNNQILDCFFDIEKRLMTLQ